MREGVALDGTLDALLADEAGRARLARVVGRFVEGQRWFPGKARRVAAVDLADWGRIGRDAAGLLLVLDVHHDDGDTGRVFVPLSVAHGEAAARVRRDAPDTVVATGGHSLVLHDHVEDRVAPALLAALREGTTLALARGRIEATATRALGEVLGGAGSSALTPRVVPGEQSNTSVVFGEHLVMKVIRRLQPGVSLEVEVGRHLTERVAFTGSPRLAGWLDHVTADGTRATLAVAHEFVAGGRDAWEMSVEAARAWMAGAGAGEGPGGAGGTLPDYARWARLLGRRTAELHLALSAGDDSAFTPSPIGPDGGVQVAAALRRHGEAALDALARAVPGLSASVAAQAARILANRHALLEWFDQVRALAPALARIRVHGDYHLGQVLATQGDVAIFDFEGEPLRPVAERREKHLALKDVAGMVRSFGYAAHAALFAEAGGDPAAQARLEPAALAFDDIARTAFVGAYRDATAGAAFVPQDDAAFGTLLTALVADRALYELVYELGTRPAWLRIPLRALAGLIEAEGRRPTAARGRT